MPVIKNTSAQANCDIEPLIQAGYRYACALQSDAGEAQGLVHEAWLKVNKRYRQNVNKALLFTAIRNLYIDKYRRAQRESAYSLDQTSDSHPEQVGETDVMELPDAQLHRALLKLGNEEREILFLSVIEGYTAEEISQLTKRARGTILSCLHRARIKLKNCLQQDNVIPLAIKKTGPGHE